MYVPYTSDQTHDLIFTGSSSSAPSKSLFEKTRAEASKVQKSMLGPRMLPPAANSQRNTIKKQVSSISFDTSSSTSVPIKKVVYRIQSDTRTVRKHPRSEFSSPVSLPEKPRSDALKGDTGIQPNQNCHSISKSSYQTKKDPTSALFIPKHKAYSQIPQSAR